MIRWRSLVGIIATGLICGHAYGSPEARHWHREVLIGANETQFFYFLFVHDTPGGRYETTNTVFVCRADKLRPNVVDSVLVRTVVKAWDSGEWTTLSETAPPFDLSDFLGDHDIAFAFPSPVYEPDSFEMQDDGLFRTVRGKTWRVRSSEQLIQQIPHLDEGSRITGIQECLDDFVYFSVTTTYDGRFEDLLLVPARSNN